MMGNAGSGTSPEQVARWEASERARKARKSWPLWQRIVWGIGVTFAIIAFALVMGAVSDLFT